MSEPCEEIEGESESFWNNIIDNLVQLKQGYWGCPLRAAVLFIGWTSLIQTAFSFLTWSLVGLAFNFSTMSKPHDGREHLGDWIDPVLYMATLLVEVPACVGLLIGVYNEWLDPIRIWIQVALATFVVGNVWEILKYGMQFAFGQTSGFHNLAILITLLLLKAYQFGQIIVVKSYYVNKYDGVIE